jgi:hypothetical protein
VAQGVGLGKNPSTEKKMKKKYKVQKKAERAE